MLQQPVSPEPGRDDNPGWAEEDWLAWCEAVEEQLGPDDEEEEPGEDAAPWDADLDAIIAQCRQVTAEEAAEPGCPLAGPARMPEAWDEFTTVEVARVLAESRPAADALLGLAYELGVRLPGTKAAFRDGIVRQSKVAIIARATALLDPAEARAAEELVLDRAGRLTPGGLRGAIARAVMEVAPEKARQRREVAEKFARVERWAEDSGNAALAGRELPPAEVFAADQRITALAQELKKAGLEGGMDELRARALLDLLLGTDSRRRQDGAGTAGSPAGSPAGGTAAGGFAGRVTLTVPLTVPLATLTGLAWRPGELPGIGPVDPNPGANTPDRYQAITRDARSRCWLSITKVAPCQPDAHG